MLTPTPAAPPSPQAKASYEAETSPAICSGSIDSNWAGFSGTGFCNGNTAVGAYAQFTVDVAALGAAVVAVRIANGATTVRPADVIMNGTRVGSCRSAPGAWSAWVSYSFTLSLNAGSNTIRFDPTSPNGLSTIDVITVMAS